MIKRVEEQGGRLAAEQVAVRESELDKSLISEQDDVIFDDEEDIDPLAITEPSDVKTEVVLSDGLEAVCVEQLEGQTKSAFSEGLADSDRSNRTGKKKIGPALKRKGEKPVAVEPRVQTTSSDSESQMQGLYQKLKGMSKRVQSRVRTVPEKDKGPPKQLNCSGDKRSKSKGPCCFKDKVGIGLSWIKTKANGFSGVHISGTRKDSRINEGAGTSAVKTSNLPVVIICVSLMACLVLTALGMYVWKTLTLTKENYESEMHKVFSELIDARAATSDSSSSVVIGQSESSEVSSSGMVQSTEESQVYRRGIDKLDLLSRITSVASIEVAIDERYLMPVKWNNLTIFVPTDMKKYEVSFEPLTVSVNSSDLSLQLDLISLDKEPELAVEDEFAELQKSSSISESVIELSKSEENRSFLQVTYKSAQSDTAGELGDEVLQENTRETSSLETESHIELSRNMYIAVLRVTDGVGLRCIYDAGSNAKVEAQNVLYEALVANVADRFV